MVEKLDYYDILGVVIPGALLVTWIPICFPTVLDLISVTTFPEAFGVIALTALAILLGHLVQAIASLIEPVIYWTWGGRPSDRALVGELTRYLPQDSATRIKKKLAAVMGGNPTDHSLFLFAMQRSDAADVGRASRFNSLYGYHRSLLVLIVLSLGLLIASMFWGMAASWSYGQTFGSLAVMVVLLMLIWHRTRQRACYYVREVLLTAERVVDEKEKEKD